MCILNDKNKVKNLSNQRIISAFAVLSISLIALLSYRDILGYFFTGMDIIPLIHSARVQSISDIKRILLEPGLKDFPDAIGVHKWYRPISVFSYSIDYAIWRLNPFGYHLTDLILHILVSVSVFFLVRLLTNGRQIIAILSAFIFTTHPLFVELVPVNARRMDTLATLFTALSLLLFLKYFSTKLHKRRFLCLSIILYVFAIGSKEIAVIVPVLIFAYSFIYSSGEQSIMAKVVQALRHSMPYFVVTSGYIALRVYVLGDIGGYTMRPEGLSSVSQQLINIALNYFISMAYPVDFLQLDSLPATYAHIPFLIILFLFIVLLLPVSSFAEIGQYGKIKKYFIDTNEGKILGFMLIWLILPLVVYLSTLTYNRYYLYISVIPFSVILALIFYTSLQSTIKRKDVSLLAPLVMRLGISACLLISFLAYSPLLRKYDGWKDVSEISQIFFYKILNYMPYMSDDAVLHVYNFPDGILINKTNILYIKEVEFPADYSIKPWVDLSYSSNNMKVTIHSKSSINDKRDKLDIQISKDNDKNVLIIVQNRNGNTQRKDH